MSLLLPLVAALVPILTLPGILFYFDVTPKAAVLAAAAAAACCLVRANSRALGACARTARGRLVLVLFGALALSLVVSTVTSTNSAMSVSGGNWRRFGLLTQLALLVFVLLATARFSIGGIDVRTTFRTVAGTGLLISLYAVAQYFGWDPLLPPAAYHVGEGVWTIVRPPGTIGHANYLGTYLIFVVFLGGSLVWLERSRAWKLLGAGAATAATFAIVLSGSRSAILGTVAGVVFLLLRVRPPVRVVLVGAVLLVAGLAIFYYSPPGQKLRSRTRWYREDPIGGARLLLWRDSLRMAWERGLAGWGPESFAPEFPRFQSIELARAYPDFYHESPHNIYLDELTAKGAFGFVSFLAFSGLAVFVSFRRRHRAAEAALAGAFLAALVSLQFNAFVLTTAFFFYLTGALLIVQRGEEEAPPTSWRTYVPVTVGGLLVTLVFSIFAIRLVAADYSLERVRRLLETGDPFAASAGYARVQRWQPPGVNSDLYYSRTMSTLVRRQTDLVAVVKAWQDAVQAGMRATRMAEDRHNAFYNLATIYATMNNPKDAERNLRGAIRAAPNWFKPHWMLAQVLLLNGKKVEARREAQAALERGGSRIPEVVESLRRVVR
jgi:hypothetical protein